jgi:hypothetical protein
MAEESHALTRFVRSGPVSGRYEGESTATPVAGHERALDLRIDIDARYPNSPVLNRLSGDQYQVQRIRIPGQPARTWRVYQESWVVDDPEVTWNDGHVDITGTVRYWRCIHPPTNLRVRVPWRTAEPIGPAAVTITQDGGETWGFVCPRTGDWFRDMNLEVDVCQSLNDLGPALPTHGRLGALPQSGGMAERSRSGTRHGHSRATVA